MSAIRNIWIVFKREIASHFSSGLAYVFIAIFVMLSTSLAFLFGRFFQVQEASLENSFFVFHPWLFMVLAPALGMRLWADEHRLGTIELLLTMPVKAWQAITGKFIASCAVLALALAMTFPMVIMVAKLGDPDGGVIWASYFGSFLVGASCLAITCAVSAFTRSLVGCLVVSVSICFALVILGHPDTVRFMAQYVDGWFFERFLWVTGVLSWFWHYIIYILIAAIAGGIYWFSKNLFATIATVCGAYLLIDFFRVPKTYGIFPEDLYTNFVSQTVGSVSLTGDYFEIVTGMLRYKALLFYVSMIGFCLFLTSVVIRTKRS